MSLDLENILTQSWDRYSVPETSIGAEFPNEPWVEDGDEDDGDGDTIALSLDYSYSGFEIQFDLSLALGQTLEVSSSERLAEDLKKELKANTDLELISVEPRSYEEFPGVVQHMRIKDTGEIVIQWLIATPEDTIFAGVTLTDKRLGAFADRFFASVSID